MNKSVYELALEVANLETSADINIQDIRIAGHRRLFIMLTTLKQGDTLAVIEFSKSEARMMSDALIHFYEDG